LPSIKEQLRMKRNCYQKRNRWGVCGFKKKCFSTVYQFWKQQYFNQKGSGLVVRLVKCSQMVHGSNPWKTFFFIKIIQTRQKGLD
jgi:hypothetical protein